MGERIDELRVESEFVDYLITFSTFGFYVFCISTLIMFFGWICGIIF